MMKQGILSQGYGILFHLVDGFKEFGRLLHPGQAVPVGEVQYFAAFLYIPDDQPPGRRRQVEPGEPGLSGVTVVTRRLKNGFYFRRSLKIAGQRRIVQPGADKLNDYTDDKQQEQDKTCFFPERPDWFHVVRLEVRNRLQNIPCCLPGQGGNGRKANSVVETGKRRGEASRHSAHGPPTP